MNKILPKVKIQVISLKFKKVIKFVFIVIKGCSFRIPNIKEIEQHRIIVTTLATTSYLLQCGVKKGMLTYLNMYLEATLPTQGFDFQDVYLCSTFFYSLPNDGRLKFLAYIFSA